MKGKDRKETMEKIIRFAKELKASGNKKEY